MDIIFRVLLLLVLGIIAVRCEQALFKSYSKNYDEEHDYILARKVANEVIRMLDERDNNRGEMH